VGDNSLLGGSGAKLTFLGTWSCTIDGKRRLTLPAKVRETIKNAGISDLITTLGQGGCLLVVPQQTLDELGPGFLHDPFQANKADKANRGKGKLRFNLARYGSVNQPDGSGRITLTADQMKITGMSKQVIVFGNWTRIEIWDRARFEAINPPMEDTDEHDLLMADYMGQNEES